MKLILPMQKTFVLAAVLLTCGMRSAIATNAAAVAEKPQDDVTTAAALIDRKILERLDQENLSPAPIASDAEFLRRVFLDIAGRIPSVSEARAFLEDSSPDKRRRIVEHLLEDSSYITHFATFWRGVLLPEAETDFGTRYQIPGFDAWLRNRLTENIPYNDLVFELLTTEIDGGQRSPTAFYQAKQIKPENLAASTSRMFLGVRLECAQCHDHPFDRWRKQEFWEFAAFFAGLERNRGGRANNLIREFFTRRTLMIPETETVVYPVFLDGNRPRIGLAESSRDALARWVTADDNPYFAPMAVNRLWGHFFGRGFVSPVDDFSDNNPPSHPELLEELAREFTAQKFDLKFLIKAITASDAYQRSSRGGSLAQPDHFARMSVKGLAADQIFNSLSQAIGHRVEFNPGQAYNFGQGNSSKDQFLERFSDSNPNPQDRQTTVLQALALMNGEWVANATKLEGSKTLAAVAEFPGLSAEDQVETLFLAALSRKPNPQELHRFANYVENGGPKNEPKQALADVFWVLLNTSEFLFNH